MKKNQQSKQNPRLSIVVQADLCSLKAFGNEDDLEMSGGGDWEEMTR